MKVTVEYTDEIGTSFEELFFVRVAEEMLHRCPLASLREKEEITLSIVAVSREKIQELNKTYRQKDSVTDILSFGTYPDTETFVQEKEKRVFLGELFLCRDYVVESAKEDEVTEEHEMIYIVSHGVLHLLGYDHSDEMFVIQDAVTETLMAQK